MLPLKAYGLYACRQTSMAIPIFRAAEALMVYLDMCAFHLLQGLGRFPIS